MASYVLNAPDPNPNPMTASRARSDIREQVSHHSQKQDCEHHFALFLASHNFITKIKIKDDFCRQNYFCLVWCAKCPSSDLTVPQCAEDV